jgi:hypothetical protein
MRVLAAAAFLFVTAAALAAQPFFITIEKVELKNAAGQWVTVIRPDRRLDLTQEEPVIRFFNNGRIAPGEYVNVRVSLLAEEGTTKPVTLERASDYAPAVIIRKGTFVGVSFDFDWEREARLSAETIREVRLTADQDERTDKGDIIKIWS